MYDKSDLGSSMAAGKHSDDHIIPISGMYKEYFLDYASYVILERAVPHISDGLKPVHRRILHSMKRIDDGRYHKVANIIGQTMQYHPHGDAAIGDALVHIGQKDLLIDCQGNWGDIRTGDAAAAARYIEARLTKFALEIAFNNQTTEWQLSYDGRNKEPITLPMKFPLLLAHGVDGIAVGLSTKILPHNFIELIKASIKVLQGKRFKLHPDFQTGGSIDIKDYNGGKRGGKVKIRANIEKVDKSTLAITELPYSTTTTNLIDSIIKANDKGKIKIKKVVDNTAKDVEVLVDLAPGVSPELTIDALYAFTNCEISLSPNACVIVDNKPEFMNVHQILEISTFNTKDLLKQELEIKKTELEEKWHMASLEKIFIKKRIYRDIEECETWESVLEAIMAGLQKYVAIPSEKPLPSDNRLKLMREITEEDLIKLTEIKIKRISKYNSFKADEQIAQIVNDLEQVNYDLDNLTDFAIQYYENLLIKYGKGKERKTEIRSFDTIMATQVVANNIKLYLDRKEGFIGSGLRKNEFISDCSDIDDIIVFRKDGKFIVTRISDRAFVGKNIIHAEVWKKDDERTTYNLIYIDSKSGRSFAKRFHVNAITRDKEYDLTKGGNGSRVLYFTSNPNGESEVVTIQLSPTCPAKKKIFNYDFADLAIKGRSAQGNIVTKYPVKKVSQDALGKSSLGAMKIWMDEVSGRINKEERGKYLGKFDTGHQLLGIYKDGSYELRELEINFKYDTNKLVQLVRFDGSQVLSVVYFEGEKSWTMVKRFKIETSTINQKFKFITESAGSKLYYVSCDENPIVDYRYKSEGSKIVKELKLAEFIDLKGWKALGNKLGEFKVLSIKDKLKAKPEETFLADKENKEEIVDKAIKKSDQSDKQSEGGKSIGIGDTIEFDF